ncbi:DUF368 domain-containing protein [Anaerovorax odorimutans]|uniref:DUF368 domain-containing protein n=1 Tax=Anaerovorax odorimutans TaxID=109327 RepID=A0ABT1RS26_9FIRM|nr:DUF368 domain-containing protein [Anaerovorax odorimutans]MCQ4638008.1 DUF368 domain-containing protein [Anaerovorax odorimutans]
MEHIKNFIYGALIGIANAIPGVSGGTMAVILNIYDKILYAVSLKNLKKHLMFLIPLALGAIAGIFALSNVIVSLMESHAMLLNFCFIGLVLGSIPSIYKKARDQKLKTRNLILGIIAFAFMIFISYLNQDQIANKSLADFGGISLWLCLWLFAAVAISTIAMILPGISGSLMMLLMGVYAVVMEAVANIDLLLMIPIGLGVATGLVVGIKVIKKMLRFHPQALYFIILGLVAGSIFAIYPGFAVSGEGFLSLGGMVIFAFLAHLLSSRK